MHFLRGINIYLFFLTVSKMSYFWFFRVVVLFTCISSFISGNIRVGMIVLLWCGELLIIFEAIVVYVLCVVFKVIFSIVEWNRNYTLYIFLFFSVVAVAFQQSTQSVPESQSSVLITMVLTGNRAVPVSFA